jgi:hypothetical protein
MAALASCSGSTRLGGNCQAEALKPMSCAQAHQEISLCDCLLLSYFKLFDLSALEKYDGNNFFFAFPLILL